MKNHKIPKPQAMWAFYNFGILIGVSRTRRGAIRDVEEHVGAPWAKARQYMQVRKVIVTPAPTKETP